MLCLHAALNKSAHYNQCNRRVESAVLSVTGMVQLMSDGSDSWRLIQAFIDPFALSPITLHLFLSESRGLAFIRYMFPPDREQLWRIFCHKNNRIEQKPMLQHLISYAPLYSKLEDIYLISLDSNNLFSKKRQCQLLFYRCTIINKDDTLIDNCILQKIAKLGLLSYNARPFTQCILFA